MGVKPLFYSDNSAIIAFANNVKPLLQHAKIDADIDHHFIARMLTTDIMMTGAYTDNTIYQHIKRLTPAHYLIVNPQQSKKKRYWQLNRYKPVHFKHEDDYVEQFRDLLNTAVKTRCQSYDKIACELSGGIDSSLVTATAAKYHHDLIAFTHRATADSGYLDESEYAKQVCQHAHIKRHILIDDKHYDIGTASQHIIQHTLLPQSVSNPILTHDLIKVAHDKQCHVILSGFGGDECVTGHGNFLKAELVKQRQWKKLWQEVSSHRSKLASGKAFISTIVKECYPKLYRKIKHQHNSMSVATNQLFANDAFLQRMGCSNSLDEFRKHYSSPSIQDFEFSMLAGENCWHLRSRIESANLFANSFNMEYRYPLLDINLLQYCINLPSDIKRKNGWGRYIARKAMQSLVPETLQWRHDKAGSPVPAALHKAKEQKQLQQHIEKCHFNQLTQEVFDKNKLYLFDNTDAYISLYTFRNGLNALQLQLLQNELKELSA